MTAVNPAPERPGQERSIEDVLSGRVRIRLAGEEYVLPVLTIGQNEDWIASMDAEIAAIADIDGDYVEVMGVLQSMSDRLLDFVYSYDRLHVLPERGEWERDIYPHEALRAVAEVRLAANPIGGLAVAEILGTRDKVRQAMGTLEQARTSSSPPRTGGRRSRSGAN